MGGRPDRLVSRGAPERLEAAPPAPRGGKMRGKESANTGASGGETSTSSCAQSVERAACTRIRWAQLGGRLGKQLLGAWARGARGALFENLYNYPLLASPPGARARRPVTCLLAPFVKVSGGCRLALIN